MFESVDFYLNCFGREQAQLLWRQGGRPCLPSGRGQWHPTVTTSYTSEATDGHLSPPAIWKIQNTGKKDIKSSPPPCAQGSHCQRVWPRGRQLRLQLQEGGEHSLPVPPPPTVATKPGQLHGAI